MLHHTEILARETDRLNASDRPTIARTSYEVQSIDGTTRSIEAWRYDPDLRFESERLDQGIIVQATELVMAFQRVPSPDLKVEYISPGVKDIIG